MPRSSIVSINHSSKRWVAISVLVQFKNRIPIEVNDLISIPQGEDRVDPSFGSHHQDVRCLGVVLRQNAPYASVRVLTGQNMTEVTNVWLKKLQFVAKGFSLGIVDWK